MDLVAPGTEDDVQHMSFPNKKSTEEERLQSLKAYLNNGKYSKVFDLSYRNGIQHWYCNVCKCPIMGRVFSHENGRRHTLNVENYHNRYAPKDGSEAPAAEENTAVKVLPGEPVPPGMEGQVTKVAHIQERFDSFKTASLLGLEYLLEIQSYDHDKEPSYLCLLCWKKGDPRTVIAHLLSYNHLQSYLIRHFPKTYQALAPYVTRQFKKNWQDAITKIVDAIEAKYGRLLPHPVDADVFQQKKEEIYQMVHSGPHFSEKNGVTFEHLVNKEELTKVYEEEPEVEKKRDPSPPVVNMPKKSKPVVNESGEKKRRLSSVSSISSDDLGDFEDRRPTNKSKSPFNRDRFERRNSRSPTARRYKARSPSPRRGRRESDLPWNKPDYGRVNSKDQGSRSREAIKEEKMAKFKRLVQAIEVDMDKVLKQHKQNPEKHPQYNDEWKIFWNKRYKELQLEGKDASKYDFKPEWILYWNNKIVEMHTAEVKEKVEALRKRMDLVDPTPISFKIGGSKKKPTGDTKLVPMAHPDNEREVIVIDDKDESPSPKRSHSPWESEPVSKTRRLSFDRVSSPECNDRRSRERMRDHSRERTRERSRERTRERSRDRSRERSRDRYHRSSSRDRAKKEYRSRDMNYRPRGRSRENDNNYRRGYDPTLECYKPPPVMRDATRKPVDYKRINNFERMQEPEPEEDVGDVNIVAVLRLLTALEDKLGSLGPKVIDMLAMALAMEKKEPNSSEKLLDNEINCVLFETVKEKLKGALHAGLVDYAQEKAFKTAIKKIATLIHVAGTRKTEAEQAKSVDPVKVPGVGTVDKAAIAKQIATALVLQGKTDVTQAELEQLINAVVGMAEASKNSDKPITTASFLEKLNTPQPKEPQPIEIIPAAKSVPSTSKNSGTDTNQTSKDSMDGLSDSDLQTLLQNFKDLSAEEQHGLITYLKKLEAKEPERVEKLRKFVNLGADEVEKESNSFKNEREKKIEREEESGRFSPFSNKMNNDMRNPAKKENIFDDSDDEEKVEVKKVVPKVEERKFTKIDSDDEEYSYEDVFKAASKNVEENKLVKERKIIEETIKSNKSIDADMLTDAKALIANIMGSIAAKSVPKIVPPVEKESPPIVTQNPTQAPLQTLSQASPNINNRPIPQNNEPPTDNATAHTPPVKTNPITLNLNPRHSFPQQAGYNMQPRGPPAPYNQNVQYPPMRHPYGQGGFNQNYGNNYNYSNQFKQNNRFHPNRGNFGNVNNRGNFNNNRW